VRWIQPCLIYEVSEDFALHEFIDGCGADGIVIQTIEIKFEEVHLSPLFPRRSCSASNHWPPRKWERRTVQSSDLIDGYEDDLCFFLVDDLFAEQRSLEIRYCDAHISDIVFLCFE
jgi:hypothetical protein